MQDTQWCAKLFYYFIRSEVSPVLIHNFLFIPASKNILIIFHRWLCFYIIIISIYPRVRISFTVGRKWQWENPSILSQIVSCFLKVDDTVIPTQKNYVKNKSPSGISKLILFSGSEPFYTVMATFHTIIT